MIFHILFVLSFHPLLQWQFFRRVLILALLDLIRRILAPAPTVVALQHENAVSSMKKINELESAVACREIVIFSL